MQMTPRNQEKKKLQFVRQKLNPKRKVDAVTIEKSKAEQKNQLWRQI